ncbi:MAG: DUF5110 domain-containing protein [Bacteroides sp.]|nr:DUF5110 domain-containing protein [Bacteroides sp.]
MIKLKFSILAAVVAAAPLGLSAATASRLNPHSVEVNLGAEKLPLLIDFYGPNVFRLFSDPQGGLPRTPEASPEAQILVDNPRKESGAVIVKNNADGSVRVETSRISIDFPAEGETFTVTDLRTGKQVAQTVSPIKIEGKKTTLQFRENPGEYFYGGGVQNGRFSHKGQLIDIVNTNSWTDGGVASPTPFYWSTDGYGLMWHTFAPGAYDFGASEPGTVSLSHNAPYLDVFIMVDETPVGLLNDFYQLTGNPVLLPKFGFYEGHLNAYNRDFWKEDENGILFEDGKKYKESQTDNGGIKESLNGELPGNYQFSARAVIDRYNAKDMPLGWVLPNDGYGAGYGQTSSLDGNIENLRQYGDYARQHGVEIGLWTQSALHPREGVEPLLQRDIVKEVRDAGVRVLKTDVAWVGAGYSFGLNGVADVGEIMPYYGNDARPFIISLDGWAGTQRYAGIWTGDQTGGEWEYIRFHIPTYIGSGLSGQPNISSDMDGIFGGRNIPVNIRDYQWKTFTPMQLNMDGWGANPKYPHQLGEDAERINRAYLKLKSELMPYAYTAAREAIDGQPMIRAMFLDYPNDYTHGTASRYQFLYGPSMLVAPIYQPTRSDESGNDVRHNIYLPAGQWFDYFSGLAYGNPEADIILNNFDAPLWKLPVFVKAGAIIPMVNPNNNPSQIKSWERIYELWPAGKSEITEYDDDGTTEAYRLGQYATTKITSDLTDKGVLTVTIDPTIGSFQGMTDKKSTELRINITSEPKEVYGLLGGKKLKLTHASTRSEFEANDAAWMIDDSANRLGQWGINEAASAIPQLLVKLPTVTVTETAVGCVVKGFELNPQAAMPASLALTAPEAPQVELDEADIQPYAVNLRWAPMNDASSLEMLFNGMLYTNLGTAEGTNTLLIEDLQPKTAYEFKLRALNPAGASDWTTINVTTADNPLEFAISGITATSSAPDQGGARISRLFDHDDRELWHTKYGEDALPLDIIMDLGSFNTLDRLEYLPRTNAGNGTLLEGTIELSENASDWSPAIPFQWVRDNSTKVITLEGQPMARYIRLHVDKAVGNFGSGREFFVFKVPGSPSFIPGDINKDGKIDSNDLTSYTNYTGLRMGDGDFDYVSMGDVNRNGLIDAFDIANVAVKLDGGIETPWNVKPIEGTLSLESSKKSYAPGEEMVLTLSGQDLQALAAFSLAIPYDPAVIEYLGIEPSELLANMENLTYDRLHTSGDKVLYPTFVTIGDKPDVNGSGALLTIRFRVKARTSAPTMQGPIMVNKLLQSK